MSAEAPSPGSGIKPADAWQAVYGYAISHGPLLVALFFIFGIYNDVSDLKDDRYSLPMAEADAMREAMANPGHKVPDPRNPGVYFEVHAASVGGIPNITKGLP